MKVLSKIIIMSMISVALKGSDNITHLKTRWSTDSLIIARKTMGIDWDEDEISGYLYAAVDSNGQNSDHIEIYRSTDNGLTWQLWYKYAATNDSSLINPRIRIARDAGDTSWVCAFAIWCESPGNDELRMRAFNSSDTTKYIEYSINYNVTYYDVESDKGDSAYVYVTYIKGDNIEFARNNLSGPWQNYDTIFSNPCSDPSPQVATDSEGNIGICFVDTSLSVAGRDEIRFVRSIDFGQSWFPVQQVTTNSGFHGISELDMAYSQDTSTHVAWISNTWTVSNNRRVGYYYSTDIDSIWIYGGILVGPPSSEEFKCNIRSNRSTGDLALIYTGDYWGYNLAYTYASDTNPTGFDDAIYVSDDSLSEIATPHSIVGWVGNEPAIMYVDYGENNVYFDWLSNTGIIEQDEKISLMRLNNKIFTSDEITLNYTNLKAGRVKVTLRNITGQTVLIAVNSIQSPGTYKCNINCEGLSSGIYLLSLDTKQGNDCRKIILLE